MKKRFTILAAAFALLAFLAIPMGMRGQEVTLDFTNNTWGLPEGSSNGQTTSASFTDSQTGLAIALEATTKYYFHTDGYLLFGKANSKLTLPAFSFAVERIEVVGRSGASTSVKQNIYVGEDAVSTETTGATGTNSYNIADDYQAAGNIYVLTVTSAHNSQVTEINVYKVGGDQPATYNVTFDAGPGTFVGNTDFPNISNTKTAGTYTLPSATPATGYTFNGWTASEITTPVTGSYNVIGDVNFTAVYTEIAPVPEGTDVLNWVATGSPTNYTDWTYTAPSGAVYAGQSSGTYQSIQLRSNNNNSGIVTTTSAGKVTNIKVTWNANTANGRTLNIYGKNSAYSAATDLYGDNAGTLIGTIVCGTSTELNITDDYEYIGMRSANNAMYLDEIQITWESITPAIVATPSFNPVSGTEFGNEGLQVTISCATDGVDLYYTLDGSEPDDESNPYNGPISLTETTTIKAIAYDGYDNTSAVATATYTYVDPNAPGTENNPYTVAQARAAIDAGTGTQGVYATGIVSAIPTVWSNDYHNITFNFVDNAGDNDFLQAYRCVSGTDVDASDVAVGDVVVVYGNLTKYNTTYEFGQGCTLVSLTHPTGYVEAPTFNPAGGTYDEAQTVTISCADENATIYYTLDGTEPTDASSQYTTAINVTTTTTIKAIAYVGTNASAVTTATYNIVSLANISDIIEVGAAYEVQGTVVATNSRGFVMGDGTGYVYYYKNGAVSQSIGDMVKVSGTTGTYGQIIQFTNTATVNEATTSNYNGAPAATVITEVPDYTQGYHLSTYLEFEGALTKTSGNYLIALGDAQIQISYPTTDQGNALTALNGKNVHVKGYFAGINSSGRFTVMLESIEEVEVQHEEYTLTVSNLVNVNTYVFDAADESEMLLEGEGSVQILDGTMVMISVDVEEGYAIESLMVDGADVTSQIDETGAYTFTMPTHNVTITATAVEIIAPTDADFVRISSLAQLTDGSIVVIAARYDGEHTNGYYAMPNTTSGKPEGVAFTSVMSDNDEILPAAIADENEAYYWVVNVTDNGYTFTNANGQVIGYTSGTNFATGGNNTEWTIELSTSESGLVPDYSGFIITNLNNTSRAFAFNGTVFGAYAKSNINGGYNFFLDFFVQTEASETVTQTIELTEGWNWFSTYIDMNEVDGLTMLEQALGDNAEMIKSKNFADEFDGEEWYRDDDMALNNEEMFMVYVINPCTVTLEGPAANPAAHPITINPGWNWIGFPCTEETDINVALSGFQAEEGDAIKSYSVIAETDGEEWYPDGEEMETLKPGTGYMYFYNGGTPQTLVYQTGAKAVRATGSELLPAKKQASVKQSLKIQK